MAKANPSVILLRGNPQYSELPLKPLTIYGGEIVPGYLCERTDENKVQPHSTADGVAAPLIAVDGLNLSPDSKSLGGIDDAYNVDEQAVKLAYGQPGEHYYMFLAAGQDTAGTNALLASNGDGTLRVSGTNAKFRALEDVDNAPGTDSLPVRIRVEVI